MEIIKRMSGRADQGPLRHRGKPIGDACQPPQSAHGHWKRLEFSIVQDPFLTETAARPISSCLLRPTRKKMAPLPIWKGRVLRVRQAMDPVGESLPDWHIMTSMANAMGRQWEYQSPNDIQMKS